ncbi:hypothetical protein ANO11243_042500 [Dothideomycetidae sp. 11243]|nr:hypothetical protein ANO11243_042500 [fungal sp. No.11243]
MMTFFSNPTWLALVLALATTSAAAGTSNCRAADVAVVRKGAANPVDFCSFYNARKRQYSPFPALTAQQGMAACRCILAKAAATPTTAAKQLPRPTTDGVKGDCYGYDMDKIKSSFTNAHNFCKFFNLFSE